MTSEQTAAVIWRFIGVFLVIAAVPGVLFSLRPLLGLMGDVGIGQALAAMLLPMVFLLVQIIVGALVLRFSKELGRMISRGL